MGIGGILYHVTGIAWLLFFFCCYFGCLVTFNLLQNKEKDHHKMRFFIYDGMLFPWMDTNYKRFFANAPNLL